MTRRLSLRISGGDWAKLREWLFTPDGHENAAVLLCGVARHGESETLLVRAIEPTPREGYIERQTYHLEIAPAFYNYVLDKCQSSGLVPVICHSHPFDGAAEYSRSDDFGERRLLPVLEALLPGRTPASLLLTKTSVAGRFLKGKDFQSMKDLTIAGPRVQKLPLRSTHEVRAAETSFFDRQLRAFGSEGQRAIASLTVAIVGLGGIGSIVAEQLVRVGVGGLILVDFDSVELSNLSRMFGAFPASVGKAKATVVAKHLAQIRSFEADWIFPVSMDTRLSSW